MKLKYYLRGAGFGMITATIILTIAFLFQDTMTDAEIMERASKLGMVMESSGNAPQTLADITKEGASQADLEEKDGAAGTDEPDKADGTDGAGETGRADGAGETDKAGETGKTDGADGTGEADVKEPDHSGSQKPTAASEANAKNPDSSQSGAGNGQDSAKPQENAGKADSAQKPATANPDKVKDKGKDSQENSNKTDEGNQTSSNSNQVTVTIEAGDVSRIVSGKVKAAGLVKDEADFNAFLGDNGYDNQLQPGTYELEKGMTFREIADILTSR